MLTCVCTAIIGSAPNNRQEFPSHVYMYSSSTLFLAQFEKAVIIHLLHRCMFWSRASNK